MGFALRRMIRLSTSLLLFLLPMAAMAQRASVSGKVTDTQGQPMFGVTVHLAGREQSVFTDESGDYRIGNIKADSVKLTFFQPGYVKQQRSIGCQKGEQMLNIILAPLSVEMQGVEVNGERDRSLMPMTRMKSVDGFGIYAGRKTEVIQMANVSANLGANRARQAFARVAGLNIWESDCSGIQLGVGGRGLSPSRSENFNTRQNGYDIAADALGYPESYYSPPMEAIERVEVVRGAASLQYGPQFGGMLNFVMKDGPTDKKFEVESRQTLASYGFFNTYNAIGGTVGRFRYYSFIQYRRGDCWRCNSEFDTYSAYGSLSYTSKRGTKLRAEYTRMWYNARQAGGLTDAQFEQDARASYRERNWFGINWNLMSVSMEHTFTDRSKLNVRAFGVIAGRDALGFLGSPDQTDPAFSPAAPEFQKNRDLIQGRFRNMGAEIRQLQRYTLLGQPQTVLIGARVYRGHTLNRQGPASAGSDRDFRFVQADSDESMSEHPSWNTALFAEHVFNITDRISITPGFRMEYIRTESEGMSRKTYRNLAGDIVLDSLSEGAFVKERWFPLFGVGVSYRPHKFFETYANFSQNYKPINFNDLFVANPTFRVDPDMRDETGFNFDLGIRGELLQWFRYDVTGFAMVYNDRIGYVQAVDPELFSVYRLRTNVADAFTVGVESLLELDVLRMFGHHGKWRMGVFSNLTWLSANYVASEESAFRDKRVELTPAIQFRGGLELGWGRLGFTTQFSYTGEQFTDATNAIRTGNAVNGIIPAYHVWDLGLRYTRDKWRIDIGMDNVLDARYFTRRATGYPGPGILPAEGRSIWVTVGLRL
jgi:Fe(3+) dicitrate transport protein